MHEFRSWPIRSVDLRSVGIDGRLPTLAVQAATLGLMLAAALFMVSASLKLADADTQYGPYGDTGKTYQNNWNDNCRWWDGIHEDGNDPCYIGVWSDTTTDGVWGTARVDEYAENHTCVYQGEYCQGTYVSSYPIPATEQALGYADVSHYCAGWPSCNGNSYRVNTRGWARHWNNSVDPVNWWTTSDGY